jgi:hypothetical protein
MKFDDTGAALHAASSSDPSIRITPLARSAFLDLDTGLDCVLAVCCAGKVEATDSNANAITGIVRVMSFRVDEGFVRGQRQSL